jgi:hypothetical protein
MKITKTDKILIPTVVLFLLFWYIYSNYFTKNMIIGTYVKTKNPDNIVVLEAPSGSDTLVLFDDGHYASHYYWGKSGTYEVSYSMDGTSIHFPYLKKRVYNGKDGFVGYGSSIERQWFSKIRIYLDRDLNIYYEKID